MGYIDEMVCWELKALRTDRKKFMLYVAAGIGKREGMENLVKKESGEDTQENPRIPGDSQRKKEKKEKMTGLNGMCQQERRRRQRRMKEGKKVNRRNYIHIVD